MVVFANLNKSKEANWETVVVCDVPDKSVDCHFLVQCVIAILLCVAYPAIYCLEGKNVQFPRPAPGSELSVCETPGLLRGLNLNFE